MKTNQVMIRKMGDFDVAQRTKDGMFNATSLLIQWNLSGMGSKKEIADYFSNKSTNEFIKSLESEEDFKDGNSPYLKSRGKYGGTWMHPYLFIDFAMWLNPSFKLKVIKFVYDKLIEYRNEAGDTYIKMCEALASISKKGDTSKNITKIAKAINIVVFGKHQSDARNKQASEESMKEIISLQKQIINLIDFGYMKTYEQARIYLVKAWQKKNQPKELAA